VPPKRAVAPSCGLTPHPDAVNSRVKPERSIHLLTTPVSAPAADLMLLVLTASY
jgi:hypothetical protein